MLFYQVNKENSNKQYGTSRTKMYYVANELFTEKECEKYNVDKSLCTPLHVRKCDTHWTFGARFINHGAQYQPAMFDFTNF
jgi:hypothetical protein